MKKQLILLVVSVFVLGVPFCFSPAFAGYQPGFSLMISPVIFHSAAYPVVYQREVYPHRFGSSYRYNQYPVRPVRTVGIVNRFPSYEDHEMTYVRHIEPVHINKFRGGHRHYQNW
jgi:hypothetical protein